MSKKDDSADSPRQGQGDPLQQLYRESITEVPEIEQSIVTCDTALLVIDLQYLDATPDQGMFSELGRYGVDAESLDYYFYQLEKVVLPNVARLLKLFRERKLEVIHTRIQSLTQDGRDRGPGHKRLGLHAAPGSKEAEFLPQVKPVGDEIIMNKTASGVFASTNLDYVLRNLEVKSLYVVGVYTNECVSSAVRDGCDLGYHITMVNDGCAAVTPDLHKSAINTLRDRYSRICSTSEVISEISELVSIV